MSSSSEEGEVHEIGQAPQILNPHAEQRFYYKTSTQNKPILIAGGYEYAYEADSRMQAGIEFYRCINRPPYCPGRIHVNAGIHHDANGKEYKTGVVKNGNHTHPPIHESVRQAQMDIREAARAVHPTKTRETVDTVRAAIPENVRAVQAPSTSAMGRNYRREVQRSKAEEGDNLLDAEDPDAIIVPQRLIPITIFDGHEDDLRMLVFMSDFGREMIQTYGSHISMDGTFKIAPAPFVQLYNICVIIDHVSIPVVYGIVLSKSTPTYRRILSSVKAAVPEWNPTTFMTDFELSAIAAVREEFPLLPEGAHSGCLFHFAQSIYRRIQRLPNLHALFLDVNANQQVHQTKTKIKCLISLAFTPPGEILYNYFCALMHQFDDNNEVEELVKYMVRTWIGCDRIMGIPAIPIEEDQELGPYGGVDQWIREWIIHKGYQERAAIFPMEVWNMCTRVGQNCMRTNNSLESWHRTFNSIFRSTHPPLSTFVKIMCAEDNHWRMVYQDFQNNPQNGIRGKSMARRDVYVEQDAAISGIYADRQNRQILQYLRAISNRMPNEV